MVRVIAVKVVTWWCTRKNILIYNEVEDILVCELDCGKDIVKIKQMREIYKQEKCDRKRKLQNYKDSVRKKIKI